MNWTNYRTRARTVIGVAANTAYMLALMLHPIMPEVCTKGKRQLPMPGIEPGPYG